MTAPPAPRYTAILLAAGRGSRFDADEGKLVQRFSGADTVAVAAARACLAAMPVLAVVAEEGSLAQALRDCGCDVAILDAGAAREMSASLRHGLQQRGQDHGWLVALADMPLVRPATIAAVVAALQAGADIAVPAMEGRRGHPVGFSRRHLDELLALRGDRGARALLQAHPVREVEVDDPGIFADIDTREDLERLRGR
ncbi:nucleotidyltransferase family protein [Herbaspirillum robiniae]|uniref:Molybdopterin-guanine dinucleotide biosynthesis protein MobA n=1 Tax=Herbaspirillum robiniae TaxID=2014887 RepID=A0A246WRT8_9BURK|nr:nucleotidyltransferase family protein [Herbaspirillum robiniae]OWY29133.1 molybdopterin-guanine dinucleotide biosynthesis protein MobA [Herbaspirillum robiniae]